jgi:hypothetical protein
LSIISYKKVILIVSSHTKKTVIFIAQSRVQPSRIRPFVSISINGKFRKGKSLTLNFFLQYLEAISRTDGGNAAAASVGSSWFQPERVGNAFNWCGGGAAVTNGMNVWSEPFVVKLSGGREVCILLLDTQGSFDNESPLQQNTVIFALSALLSSVMIMNVEHDITEDMLQFFQLFTGFAQLAMRDERVSEQA